VQAIRHVRASRLIHRGHGTTLDQIFVKSFFVRLSINAPAAPKKRPEARARVLTVLWLEDHQAVGVISRVAADPPPPFGDQEQLRKLVQPVVRRSPSGGTTERAGKLSAESFAMLEETGSLFSESKCVFKMRMKCESETVASRRKRLM